MALIHLTDKNFKQEVLQAEGLVLVDFWATWCSPCKMLTPIIEEVEREYDTKLRVGKLNVEEAPRIATQYGIMSVPTLIFFKKGKALEQFVGVLDKVSLKRKIQKNL